MRWKHEGSTHGHDKRVAHAGRRVRELVRELDVVVVKPAARDGREVTVECDDARLREERGEDVADDTANRVRRKDLEREEWRQQMTTAST